MWTIEAADPHIRDFAAAPWLSLVGRVEKKNISAPAINFILVLQPRGSQ
jgi:hypothetical protein